MTTSTDLMTMLRASMAAPSRPSPGYVVGELEAPSGGRRADALFLPLGHARRGEIHGYEFKISRADLVTELNDPMKADPWLRYCTTWTLFVATPALITGLDIPEAWGIVAPPASERRRALTVIRPAPKLRPLTQMGPALLQVIARLYYADGPTEERMKGRLERAEIAEQQLAETRRRAETAERKLARLDPTERGQEKELMADVINALGSDWLNYGAARQLGAQRIAELLGDVATLERIAQELATKDLTDLEQLERVHADRGRRLAQTRQDILTRLHPITPTTGE